MLPLQFFAALALLVVGSYGKDPEEDMSTPEIIEYWGYPAEVVQATTEDGYILDMHRIPWSPKLKNSEQEKPVVFMQHGLEASSSNWITNLPNESAGFIFSDAGFDVWLGNMRGNTYGKNHKTLSSDNPKFWKFSWDEMMNYDLEAQINTVLNKTGAPYVYYIGHSQGTLTMFSKLSTDQTFYKKIKQYHALAPIGTVKYIDGLIDWIALFLYPEFDIIFDILGSGEFLPSDWLTKLIADWVCGNLIGNLFCDNILFLITGPESDQFNMTRMPVYLAHAPAGTSSQNILHWAQMVLTGQIEAYDYQNTQDNINHYGQAKPPLYDYTLVNADTYIYWSPSDWLADEKDIKEHLLPNINPNYLKENNKLDDFNHMDFVWGLRAAEEVYYPIINTIKKDLGQTFDAKEFKDQTKLEKINHLKEKLTKINKIHKSLKQRH